MGYPMHYDDPAAVMEEISRTTPIMGGIHYERLEGKGLIWPCPLDIHPAHPAYREFHQRQRPLFQPGDIDSVQAGG
jgi:predicted molibdopterin-dependent oxidoreductase YjgC